MSTDEGISAALNKIAGALPPYFVEQYERLLTGISITLSPRANETAVSRFLDIYSAHARQKTPEEAITYAYAILEALGWEELDDLRRFVNRSVVIDTSMNEELKRFQKFEAVYKVMGILSLQLGDYQLSRYRLAVTVLSVLERVTPDKSFVEIFTILRQKLTLYPLAVAFTIKVLERSGWGDTKKLKPFALPNFDLNERYPVVDLCLTVADYYGNMEDKDFSIAKTFVSAVHLNDMNVRNYNRVDFTLLLLEQRVISVGDVSKIKDDLRYPVFFKEYEGRHKVPHHEGYSRPGPTYPPGPAEGELNINHMPVILQVLKEAMFGAVYWQHLGLSLGLYMSTLNVISRTNDNANDYLRMTIQEWLEKKDGVRGTTWRILIDAVKRTGDSAAAQRISTILELRNIVKTQNDEKVSAPVPPVAHFPKLQDIETEFKSFSDDLVKGITVLLMTATSTELQGIMGYLKPKDGNIKIIQTIVNGEKVYIGKYGKCPVVVGMSAQGPTSACNITTKLMNTVKPHYVIAVGICYGMDKSKASSGDVIVSNLICDYTSLHVGDTLQPRGGIHLVGRTLLQVFSSPIGYSHTQDGKEVKVHCGPIITGPLVVSSEHKEQLKHFWPDALGGEMEGAGIMAAIRNATYVGVEAIVIKAICDWGDGKKSEAADWKPFSSHAAARYVYHQMDKPTNILIGNDAPEATATTVSPETIEKWLQEGTVDLTVTRINMHGASGSGKTCTQLLLLNEPPPPVSVTDSTPIARPAVKATRISIDDQNMKWERVTTANLLDQLASHLKKSPKETSQPSVQEEAPGHKQNEREDMPLHHSDDEAQKELLDATEKVNEDTSERVDEPHQSNDEAQESTDATEKVFEDIVEAYRHTKTKLSTNWAYFIDSGGQPAYRELLPLFTRTAALNIITIDLTKGLHKKCEFEYRIDEKNLPINTEMKYSNLDIIRSTISSEAILKPIKVPYVTKTPDHPNYLVIGTRKEEVTEEDIEAMNQTLKDSNLKLQHIIWKKLQQSIIFPVNTISAISEERRKASEELCTAISNRSVSMKIKMPIRLFVFEIALQAAAKKKNRSFLTKKEVIVVGKYCKIYNEDIENALQYLHNVTIILYYPDALSGFVFVDPQPILDILSRLIAITYVEPDQLKSIANNLAFLQDNRYNLSTSGCFKEDLLNIVGESVFVYNLFEPCHMIELLKHLHIIAEVKSREEGHYFFPCALRSPDKCKYPPSTKEKIKPLLVVWKQKNKKDTLPVPQGVFPLIVVHLLNQKDEVDFSSTGPDYYKCHNAMSLQIYEKYTLHIINRYTHIEMHFDGDMQFCPKVWELVEKAIKDSSDNINVEQSHNRAFKCTKKESCYCIVKDDHSTYCTKCSYHEPPNDDSYWCWFSDSQPGQGGTAKRPKTTEEEAGLEETDSGPAPVPPVERFRELKDIEIETKPFSTDLVQDITVLLMTATPVELRGVMGYLEPKDGNKKIIQTFTDAEAGKIKFYIGKYGQYPVAVGMSAPGKGHQGLSDATNVMTKLMNTFKPRYVIAVGICYGMDKVKTSPGDVIVSEHIVDATCLRVEDTLQLRGGIPSAGATLLQVFSSPVGYSHTYQHDKKKSVEVHCSPFISRPDLVDNPDYKEQLKRLRVDALGGEMEGAGIMAAVKNASYVGVEAIIIKAICDWADGKKSKAADWKPFSSHAAARYVHHQMNNSAGVLSEHQNTTNNTEHHNTERPKCCYL